MIALNLSSKHSNLKFYFPSMKSGIEKNRSVSEGESLEQPTEEHPSKTANIQISNSSNIKDNLSQRDFQSPFTTKTETRSLIKIETETPHTKENEATTPLQKDIQTPLLESMPKHAP